MIGKGFAGRELTSDDIREIVKKALFSENWNEKRVLLIIPDATRSAPVDVLYKVIHEKIHAKVACLDILIALGESLHELYE